MRLETLFLRTAAPMAPARWWSLTASSPWPSPPKEEREPARRLAKAEQSPWRRRPARPSTPHVPPAMPASPAAPRVPARAPGCRIRAFPRNPPPAPPAPCRPTTARCAPPADAWSAAPPTRPRPPPLRSTLLSRPSGQGSSDRHRPSDLGLRISRETRPFPPPRPSACRSYRTQSHSPAPSVRGRAHS